MKILDTTKIVPGRIRRWFLRRMFEVKPREDIVRLGSDYDGWLIPSTLLSIDSVCYCAGVGEDVTFDLALIDRFGCTVHAFDPTPEAVRHVQSLGGVPPAFVFHQYGVWSSDTMVRFYAPRDPSADISHSALNLQNTSTYFEAPVKSLSSIMRELGHRSIDVLKMDIEGAEHTLLQHMAEKKIWPTVLCIEFDQPCSIFRIRSQIRMLAMNGYDVVANERWNFTFVNQAS